MKSFYVFAAFFLLNLAYGQKCSCSQNEELKGIIPCEKTRFQNGAKIFWEYDCNSSWITFQNKNIRRKIFELEKEFIALSGRLGYRSWTEYKSSFLIENSMISGCCQPEEYMLYNKNTGRKIAELGTFISLGNDTEKPYILTMKTDRQLLYTNLNNNKACFIRFPKDKIEKTLKNTHEMHPEILFEDQGIHNGILSVKFKYKESEKSDWKEETLRLNTGKCSK
ncbi:hypothetical protein [Chryseobacterium arthrosphaerae]|uniref:Uncharacterized protein n=1 Tax=Chryseobacterium arthrosphaerae TaxID=651561 RepID=A0A1B8ZUS0_9FLAO|nr:hypothetical protein [Chryseobacterium arthrosphaerae]OCA75335.1 hypothetical protein BBI00_13780 [Chryseobacterium arthrosphaerae]